MSNSSGAVVPSGMRLAGLLLLSTGLAQAQLTITTATPLPNGNVGVPYSQTITATGGTGTHTWSESVPCSPAGCSGIALSPSSGSSVTFGGTPTTAGTFSVTIQVTNPPPMMPQTASKTFTFTINAPLNITNTSPLSGGLVGVAYSVTFTATGGTGTGYNFTQPVGTLPPGLFLGASTGTLSGTPTLAGTYDFTIRVTDSSGSFFDKAFSVTFASGLDITTTSPLPVGIVGVAYSQTFTAVGGTGSGYTFSIVSGTPPAGLSIPPGGSALSGTPTTAGGPTMFMVRVTDSGGNTLDEVFALTINPALTITTGTPLPSGVLGSPYSQAFAAAGGTGAGYVFSLQSGTPPPGLSITGGALSGTPTSTGPFSFTVRVADSGGNIFDKGFAITILSGLN
ncbi:MAG: Ig domain-containing protein, partial [Bryobacteraceae bacterium]